MKSKSKFSGNTRLNSDLLDFLIGLQHCLSAHLCKKPLPIFTKHVRNGQTFRGHPNFRGKGPWKDWAMVDWGSTWGRIPCHIWCFVVLDCIPSGQRGLNFGGVMLQNGVFGVVESGKLVTDENMMGKSDLMYYVNKDVPLDANGYAQKRNFYLADTEAFVDPLCVIPDLGGPSNRYLVVKARNQWAKEFERWVDDAHIMDEMDPLDAAEDEDEVMNALEEDGAASDES